MNHTVAVGVLAGINGSLFASTSAAAGATGVFASRGIFNTSFAATAASVAVLQARVNFVGLLTENAIGESACSAVPNYSAHISDVAQTSVEIVPGTVMGLDVVPENVSMQDTAAVRGDYLATAEEVATTVASTHEAFVSFMAALEECAFAVPETGVNGAYNVAVEEAADILFSLTGKFLWDPVDDNQSANWQNIEDAQAPGWRDVTDAQTPGWRNQKD